MNTRLKSLLTGILALGLLFGSIAPVLANNRPDSGITADPILNVAHFAPFEEMLDVPGDVLLLEAGIRCLRTPVWLRVTRCDATKPL